MQTKVATAIVAAFLAGSVEAQEAPAKIPCFSTSSPKACETINENEKFVAKFRKVFPANYGLYVNSSVNTSSSPLRQHFLYGAVDIVRIASVRPTTWSPVYNIPFFNRRDDDPKKWLDKQDRDNSTAFSVINAISERIDKGELAP